MSSFVWSKAGIGVGEPKLWFWLTKDHRSEAYIPRSIPMVYEVIIEGLAVVGRAKSTMNRQFTPLRTGVS